MLTLQRRRLSGFALAALAPALLIGPAVVTGVTIESAVALPTVRTLGTGSQPGLAVDSAGTAYIAWNGPENASTLRFCKLPRGAASCTGASSIATAGATTTRPWVSVAAQKVVVVTYRYPLTNEIIAGTYVYISTNGGDTFSDGIKAGSVPFYEAVPGPGDMMSGANSANGGGLLFQSVDTSGDAFAPPAALLSTTHPYYGSVALLGGATPVAAYSDGASAAQFRRYDGSGDANDAANWLPPINLGYAAYPKVAAGTKGLFLQAGTSLGKMYVRKYNGAGFNAALSLGDGNPASHHISHDPGGRVHSVIQWANSAGLHLKHWVTDDGVAWRGITVATQNPGVAGGFSDPRVATAADHRGVAVWSTSSTHVIKLVEVGAVPKPKPIVNVGGVVDRRATGVPTTITGSLTRPTGVPASVGCAGTVTVKLKRGTTVIFAKNVNVTSTCKFGFNTTLSRGAVGAGTTKLGVVARFNGNSALAVATKTRTLPVT